MKKLLITFLLLSPSFVIAQVVARWINVDSLYQPLPASMHVYYTNQLTDSTPFRAYYVSAELTDRDLQFFTDTTLQRRLTPSQFYQKNNQPLLVVNGTFFSFESNRNLNIVVKNGEMVSLNAPTKGRGKDSLRLYHAFKSAIGITKDRRADVAYIYTDSATKFPMAFQLPVCKEKSFVAAQMKISKSDAANMVQCYAGNKAEIITKKWKMHAAIGGGPSLLQNGEIKITNDEERMFAGKAINDKHPRTVMGYTKDRKLIVLAIEGRNPQAAGATLIQEAEIMKELGCVEALNLDGGGSTCLLINGKLTIQPSDKGIQRAVPAVFAIDKKKK